MDYSLGTQIYMVTPNDANQHGTVFGGKILEWADQAGAVLARRYCHKPVLTASLERIDFWHPIQMGEEAHLTPKLLYAHKHSMQISVEVKGINPFKEKERVTAQILLSFVAIDEKNGRPASVPPWQGKLPKEVKACRGRFVFKERKIPTKKDLSGPLEYLGKKPAKLIQDSFVENHHMVMPSDQNNLNLLFAGRFLSWVDIVGALSARRHCETPVVTASIEEVDFKQRVPKGSTIRLEARPIFSAEKSVQIQVIGWLWDEYKDSDKFIADAFLTFVALDRKNKKPTKVPQLKIQNKEQEKLYLMGQWRYFKRKNKH